MLGQFEAIPGPGVHGQERSTSSRKKSQPNKQRSQPKEDSGLHLQGPLSEEWRSRLLSFLGHKGQSWLWQIENCLFCDLAPLESHFFVHMQTEPVANVCLTCNGPVAILSHVYVHPDFRGRGLARQLLHQCLMGQESRRIYLGCEPAAERLYSRFGFRPLIPGFMARGPQPDLAWSPPTDLRDWPRVVHHGSLSTPPVCWEGAYLAWLQSRVSGRATPVSQDFETYISNFQTTEDGPR